MRKYLDVKSLSAKAETVADTVDEARVAARRIGEAAESQATLNIALTAVCVAALLVAVLVVRDARGGAL